MDMSYIFSEKIMKVVKQNMYFADFIKIVDNLYICFHQCYEIGITKKYFSTEFL